MTYKENLNPGKYNTHGKAPRALRWILKLMLCSVFGHQWKLHEYTNWESSKKLDFHWQRGHIWCPRCGDVLADYIRNIETL